MKVLDRDLTLPDGWEDTDAHTLAGRLRELNPGLDQPIIYALELAGPPDAVVNEHGEDTMTVTPEAITAGAVGSTSLTLGSRDEAWDAGAARRSMNSASDYKAMHFWQVPDADPALIGSYKLPFATNSGGRHAVWRGVTAAAARLNQTQGVDEGAVRSKMNAYYAKAKTAYSDDTIAPPWESAAFKPSPIFEVELAAIGLVWCASAEDADLGSYQTVEQVFDTINVEFARRRRHDYRGSGGPCEVCGESPGDEEYHWQEGDHDAAARTAAATATGNGWVADPLMFLDQMTRDGRILAAANEKEGWRGPWWTDTPKSLMAQTIAAEGHMGAFLAGTMPGEQIQLAGDRVLASGDFNDDEDGERARSLVANRSLTGISVDLAPQKWQIEIDPGEEGGILFFSKDEPEPEDERIVISQAVDDVVLRFTDYEVAGSTLVSTPAFGAAQVSLAADADGVQHRIVQPGIGGVHVRFRTSERGWPIPVGLVAGGWVGPAQAEPVYELPDGLRPHTVAEFNSLVDALDRARLAGLLDERLARAAFAAAIRRMT